LLEIAFSSVGLDWKKYVEVDPALIRPAESASQCGDAAKARRILGWKPEINFRQLIEMMVDADLARLRPQHGPIVVDHAKAGV
jgi:GDPmannose 4,6-dehydratase